MSFKCVIKAIFESKMRHKLRRIFVFRELDAALFRAALRAVAFQ